MDTEQMKKFAPLGLTIGGCICAIGIGFLSHRDTIKARKILAEKESKMEGKDKVKATWKCYIPTGIVTALSVGCTIAAYILKEKQIGAITAGLALTGGLLSEYKDAIKEKFGDEGYEEVVKLVAKPHESEIVNAIPNDISTRGLLEVEYDRPDEGNQLFYDSLLHVWFRASKDAFDLGRYFLNRNYILGMEVTLKDFYDFMCVPLDKVTQDVAKTLCWGFDEDNAFYPWLEWIDISLTPSEVDDGEPYYIIEYVWEPIDQETAADYNEEYKENL